MSIPKFNSFQEFYPFYLSQHENKMCRLLHMIGTTIVLALFFTGLYHGDFSLWLYIPLAGYGFAWVGHFFYEKNKPATFKHPLWSLRGDFQMYFDLLQGKIPLDGKK
ncbi:MAG: Mpo1-like protein [Flavobacteriaceae bacterium]